VLFARLIVRIGPLADTDTATLAPLLGAALQTYLDGDAPEVQS